jgi:hypothetical protein
MMADLTNTAHHSPHSAKSTRAAAACAAPAAEPASLVKPAALCTRSAGCACADCNLSAQAMGLACTQSAAQAMGMACTRSAGCACAECNVSAAAMGGVASRAADAVSASAPSGASYTMCAINFNDARTPGATYDVETDGKLGSVYTMLAEVLAQRGDWQRAKAARKMIEEKDGEKREEMKLPRSFQLLLGTAQGKGIKFAQLGYGMWPPPLVNYYRGFNCLCRKALLIQLLVRGHFPWTPLRYWLFYP